MEICKPDSPNQLMRQFLQKMSAEEIHERAMRLEARFSGRREVHMFQKIEIDTF